MPLSLALEKIVRRRRKPPGDLSRGDSFSRDKTTFQLDTCITVATLVKDGAGMAPIPYIKSAAEIVLRILETVRMSRTNRHEFDTVAKDITDVLVSIRDLAITLGDFENQSIRAHLVDRCESFTAILLDMIADLDNVKRTVSKKSVNWSTPAMQSLLKQYQDRLKLEMSKITLLNVVEIHTSVQRTENVTNALSEKLTRIYQFSDLGSTGLKEDVPELENYQRVLLGDFQIVEMGLETAQMYERLVTHGGDKTLRVFLEDDAAVRWQKEINFYHKMRTHPHVQQLFGYVKTEDITGLVFHEHLQSFAEIWDSMQPINKVLSMCQMYLDSKDVYRWISRMPESERLITSYSYYPAIENSFGDRSKKNVLSRMAGPFGRLQVVYNSHVKPNKWTVLYSDIKTSEGIPSHFDSGGLSLKKITQAIHSAQGMSPLLARQLRDGFHQVVEKISPGHYRHSYQASTETSLDTAVIFHRQLFHSKNDTMDWDHPYVERYRFGHVAAVHVPVDAVTIKWQIILQIQTFLLNPAQACNEYLSALKTKVSVTDVIDLHCTSGLSERNVGLLQHLNTCGEL